jgi:hypothetical protein
MAKSYVPTLVRLLRHVCLYITKHQAVINNYLTSTQQTDLNTLATICNDFVLVVTQELP